MKEYVVRNARVVTPTTVMHGHVLVRDGLVADVDEGHFVLLPAEKSFIAIAITSTRLILMHAGPLSEMITDEPEWNPDRPVILPICPALAKTLYIIEYYQNEKRSELN